MDSIKRQYKGQLIGLIFNGYLSLKRYSLCCATYYLSVLCRLVIQRTKRIDESQICLQKMIEALTSGTDREKEEFMAVCIQTLTNFPMSDIQTPVHVFEQLCNLIHRVWL